MTIEGGVEGKARPGRSKTGWGLITSYDGIVMAGIVHMGSRKRMQTAREDKGSTPTTYQTCRNKDKNIVSHQDH